MADTTSTRLANLSEPGRQIRDSQDQMIFEKHAERLNREASDVLSYQRASENKHSAGRRVGGKKNAAPGISF